MKIAAKFTLALMLVLVAVVAVTSVIRSSSESREYLLDMQHDHHLMGRGLGAALAEVWREDGEERALRLVSRANERESALTLRWVWLDARAGSPHATQTKPGTTMETSWVSQEGVGHLYTFVPIATPSGRLGGIEISESLERRKIFLNTATRRRALTGSLLVLASTVVVMVLGSLLIGRPVRQLIDHSRRVGSGDFSGRLDVRQRDELGELAVEMNGMTARLQDAIRRVEQESAARIEAVEQLRQADRLRTVGQLASGVAHELGTPLNVVGGYARMIATAEVSGNDIVESAQVIQEQTDRMTAIIRQLLDFARGRKPKMVEDALAPIIERTATLLSTLARKSNIDVRQQLDHSIKSHIDGSQLQQVITNLMVNAIHAMPDGGTLKLSLERTIRHKKPFAAIAVADTGSGIPADVLPRLFEPFFSTKGIGEGTGLGLAVSYGIVAEHGGFIDVMTGIHQGSTFTVYLPLES